MIVCGLKLTHDGSVAVIDDGQLVFSVEMEKIGNSARYSKITDLDAVPEVLRAFGYEITQVDRWVIDGWDGRATSVLRLSSGGAPVELTVAGYRESEEHRDLLSPSVKGEVTVGGRSTPYRSHPHAAGHVIGAYCSSEFARRGEPSFVLVWDGGMFPQLYWVDPAAGVVENGGSLFPLFGHAYALAGFAFGPFVRGSQPGELWVAGKLMAYIASGKARQPILDLLQESFAQFFEGPSPRAVAYRRDVGGYGSHVEPSRPAVEDFLTAVRTAVELGGHSGEDVLASVHQFMADLLARRIERKVRGWKGVGPWNLCFAGGCALNIKWNTTLRSLPTFTDVWVPPFCNDSGSAIGMAALGMVADTGIQPIRWDVRSGPALAPVADLPAGWEAVPAGPRDLARLLHETDEPVIVLTGRAELGPRALGGRSILAAATSPSMKGRLNGIKGREDYRPVAPICLLAEAPRIFDPGIADPYMLFDHRVRDEWVSRIPAVVHLDGTARLQTVDPAEQPLLAEILGEYWKLSGVPVLCNTSANRNGCGFFPDPVSAMSWGQVDRVWSDGVLYQRRGRVPD